VAADRRHAAKRLSAWNSCLRPATHKSYRLSSNVAARLAKPQPLRAQICAETQLVEAHAHARMAHRLFDQHAVQVGPPRRPNDFVLALAVRLQRDLSGELVNHAPAHRDQQRAHALHDSGALERAHTACGEREVDGAPALGLDLARIRPALLKRHTQAAPGEQQREQRAGESRADDVDAALRRQTHRVSCSACLNASAKRQASAKRL
jgi:hypothetical protein